VGMIGEDQVRDYAERSQRTEKDLNSTLAPVIA